MVGVGLLLAFAASSLGQEAEIRDSQQLEAKAPKEHSVSFLPGDHLFKTLIADLRWPHFAFAYQNYLKDPQLGSVAAISLGESIILYRDRIGGGKWEVGIQARQRRLPRRAGGRLSERPVLRSWPAVPPEQPPWGRVHF